MINFSHLSFKGCSRTVTLNNASDYHTNVLYRTVQTVE